MTRGICLQGSPKTTIENVTQSMEGTTLRTSDTAMTWSDRPPHDPFQPGLTFTGHPPSRRQAQRPDLGSAAQYSFPYQGIGQDPALYTRTGPQYGNEERLRAEREARLQAEREERSRAEMEARSRYEEERRAATNPPQQGPRPNTENPYATPSISQPPAGRPPRHEERGPKQNTERGDKKRSNPNSPGSSQSSNQKKKQSRLPYDPARNGH